MPQITPPTPTKEVTKKLQELHDYALKEGRAGKMSYLYIMAVLGDIITLINGEKIETSSPTPTTGNEEDWICPNCLGRNGCICALAPKHTKSTGKEDMTKPNKPERKI